MIKLHFFHGLEIEFFTAFNFSLDYFGEAIGSSCGELMNTGSLFIVIGGKLVVSHRQIPFLGIENDRFFLNGYVIEKIILVRVAVFYE